MTDTENESHFFLRQPWICFHKLAKSLQIGDLSAMTFLIVLFRAIITTF